MCTRVFPCACAGKPRVCTFCLHVPVCLRVCNHIHRNTRAHDTQYTIFTHTHSLGPLRIYISRSGSKQINKYILFARGGGALSAARPLARTIDLSSGQWANQWSCGTQSCRHAPRNDFVKFGADQKKCRGKTNLCSHKGTRMAHGGVGALAAARPTCKRTRIHTQRLLGTPTHPAPHVRSLARRASLACSASTRSSCDTSLNPSGTSARRAFSCSSRTCKSRCCSLRWRM